MKKLISFFLAIVPAVLAVQLLAAAAEKVVGGPFVVSVTARTAKICWIVQSDEVSLKPLNGEAIPSPAFRVETTSFTLLQPNTRYEYNISSLGEAGRGSFKTPPLDAQPFRFLVYGDNRTRHDVHRRVVAQ